MAVPATAAAASQPLTLPNKKQPVDFLHLPAAAIGGTHFARWHSATRSAPPPANSLIQHTTSTAPHTALFFCHGGIF